jgi:RNA polymerase sigma-70 factor (ECF subfamily)
MPLTELDKELIRRCLTHQTGAWNDFVDRYVGLIYHVIHHTCYLRSVPLSPEDTEDLAAEILLEVVKGDYALLRQFHGKSSLAAYLTVIARRIAVHALQKKMGTPPMQTQENLDEIEAPATRRKAPAARAENMEEVEKLLRKLKGKEREVVRLYFLEGRSYEEISNALNIPVNSIGPFLARAKKRLKGDTAATNGQQKQKTAEKTEKVEKTTEAQKTEPRKTEE